MKVYIRGAAILIMVSIGVLPARAATGPTVSNVSASQETEGAKRLVITYDLLDADSSIVDVTFVVSADGGSNYDVFPSAGTCTGDIGHVAPGAGKTIYWDVMSDYPEESGSNYKVRVTADDLGFFVDLGGGVMMEMVYIPAGSFEMGSYDGEYWTWCFPCEQPVHTVTFAEPFYMAATELTEAQWEAVMGSWPLTDPDLGDDYPATDISWNDIRNTGGLIDQMNALGQGVFSLPTEAQWEYACRAGTTTRFSFGDSTCSYTGCTSCELDDYAWWCGNSSNHHEVGGKPANPWGLFDMHGSVHEWCEDDWHSGYYTGVPMDGSAWIESPRAEYRVLRGGDWCSSAAGCRSAARSRYYPSYRWMSVGLGCRLVAVR